MVSSETWSWVTSPSFRARPIDLQGEAHEHLLSGVNQFVGHGWPFSPRDAPDPGWGSRFTMQEIDLAFEPTRTGIFVVPHLH